MATYNVDSNGRYDTGAPAWLGLNPDGSLKKKKENSSGITQPSTNNYDIEGYIEDLARAQRQAAIAGLNKARSSALSNLESEKSQIQPQYYDKRNQANVNMNNSARNFSEFLAQRGLQRSGVAAQGAINNLNAYQRTLGELGRQEQQAYDDIARRMTDVENAYLSDVEAAKAGIQAQAMQALIADLQRQRELALQQDQFNRQFGLQEAGLTGTYQGTPTLDALNAQRQFALQEAGLTGTYNGLPTLAAQQMVINKALSEAGLTGIYNGTPTLQARQFDWETGGAANALEFQKAILDAQLRNSLALQRAKSSGSSANSLTKTEAKDINVADYKSAIDSLVNQSSRYITNTTSAYKIYTNILDMIERDSQSLRAGGLTNSDIENLKKYARTKIGL